MMQQMKPILRFNYTIQCLVLCCIDIPYMTNIGNCNMIK